MLAEGLFLLREKNSERFIQCLYVDETDSSFLMVTKTENTYSTTRNVNQMIHYL